jgi:hypothetical protein
LLNISNISNVNIEDHEHENENDHDLHFSPHFNSKDNGGENDFYHILNSSQPFSLNAPNPQNAEKKTN